MNRGRDLDASSMAGTVAPSGIEPLPSGLQPDALPTELQSQMWFESPDSPAPPSRPPRCSGKSSKPMPHQRLFPNRPSVRRRSRTFIPQRYFPMAFTA